MWGLYAHVIPCMHDQRWVSQDCARVVALDQPSMFMIVHGCCFKQLGYPPVLRALATMHDMCTLICMCIDHSNTGMCMCHTLIAFLGGVAAL